MVEFFRESTGHFIQILDALARHLVASVEVCYFGLKEKRSGKFSGLGYWKAGHNNWVLKKFFLILFYIM